MIKSIITNIIVPVIAVAGVGMAIYDSMVEDPRIAENMRIADSLRAEATKYKLQYDSLLMVAAQQDLAIATQKQKIDSLKKNPPVIVKKTSPPVTNSNEAVQFLEDFIKE